MDTSLSNILISTEGLFDGVIKEHRPRIGYRVKNVWLSLDSLFVDVREFDIYVLLIKASVLVEDLSDRLSSRAGAAVKGFDKIRRDSYRLPNLCGYTFAYIGYGFI